MRILGVDPGYDRLGIAVLDSEMVIFSDCILTNRESAFEDRIHEISTKFESVLSEYSPEVVAIEKLFFNTNQKTAMRVAEVCGAIIASSKSMGLSVREYTPPQIKVAVTGYGRSTKAQLADMVNRLLTLPDKKRLDDEYDAIAVALTCQATISGLRK